MPESEALKCDAHAHVQAQSRVRADARKCTHAREHKHPRTYAYMRCTYVAYMFGPPRSFIIGLGEHHRQWTKHAWLHSDLLQAIEGELFSFGLTTEGTVISESEVPHSGFLPHSKIKSLLWTTKCVFRPA